MSLDKVDQLEKNVLEKACSQIGIDSELYSNSSSYFNGQEEFEEIRENSK